MFAACFLSFSAGFLSLSLEILWVRLFSFVNYSVPQAFAFVLVFYLIGIAIGAAFGKRFCENNVDLWKTSGTILLLSGISDIASPWLYVVNAYTSVQLLWGATLIVLTAALKAIIFPIAHHLGTPSSGIRIGRSLSRVYVSNILGATLGPIVTGMLLLSKFSTQQCFIICASLTFLLSIYCVHSLRKQIVFSASVSFMLIMMVIMTVWLHPNQLIIHIADKKGHLRRIIENQHGIITTYYGGKNGDWIAGNNVYDGRTNLDPAINSNHINRLLILPVIQEKPERILMVGLSIGTWLKLVTSFPSVKTIDVIEMNPGYLRAMQDYPQQKSALSDSRVHLHIDDGRRWLKTHPEKQYDLIIMNTTHSWRAYSTNLLSYEFLSLAKQHMHKDSICAYNTTESPDAFKTATVIFAHAYLYNNFVIASDIDWRTKLNTPKAAQILSSLSLNGKPLFPLKSDALITSFLTVPILSVSELEAVHAKNGRELHVITDNNPITEYKYGKGLNLLTLSYEVFPPG